MSEQIPFVAPFVVLEGDEGCGKSLVAVEVVERLRAKGIEVIHTREPGGTPMGEVLREQLLMRRDEPLDLVTHILLHQAYRKEHIEKIIMPALTSGKVVICERFFMSTLALNILPYMQERPELYELFMQTMPAVSGNLIEPVTFLLDVNEDVRQLRLLGRVEDHYESRSAAELQATSDAYKMFQKHPTTITLDGALPAADLADHIVSQIEAQITQARTQAAEFERQQAECTGKSSDELLEEAFPGVTEAPAEPEPFDLVATVESFLDEHLVPALFNGDATQVETYRPLARSYLLSLYSAANDQTIFEGQNRNQLRVSLHSIFHFGHQLDLLRSKQPATPAAE